MPTRVVKKYSLKSVAAILCFLMLHQEICSAVPANSIASGHLTSQNISTQVSQKTRAFKGGFADFRLPSELGEITHFSDSGSEQAVIHIQDLHINETAQIKIARIIDHLAELYNVRLIQVEGATGVLRHGLLSRYPDYQTRKLAARLFLKEGLLSGSEYLAIVKRPELVLYGAENPKLYERNRTALLEALKLSGILKPGLETFRKTLDKLGTVIFSPEARAWVRSHEAFESDESGILDYARSLKSICAEHSDDSCETEHIDRLLKWEALSRQKKEDELKEMMKNEKPLGLEIYDEIKKIETLMERKFLLTPDSRRLYGLYQIYDVYKKMFSLALTRSHVEFLYENRARFEPSDIQQELRDLAESARLSASGAFSGLEIFDAGLRAYEKFYEAALERDQSFAEKPVKVMKKAGEKITILVTGGFHTPAIEESLRKQGVSFCTIMPKIDTRIEHEKDQALYLKSMALKDLPLSRLLAAKDAGLQLQTPSRIPSAEDFRNAQNLQPADLLKLPKMGDFAFLMLTLAAVGLRRGVQLPVSLSQTLSEPLSAAEKKLAEIYSQLDPKNIQVKNPGTNTGAAVVPFNSNLGFGLSVKWKVGGSSALGATNTRQGSFSFTAADRVASEVRVLSDPDLVTLAQSEVWRFQGASKPRKTPRPSRSEVRNADEPKAPSGISRAEAEKPAQPAVDKKTDLKSEAAVESPAKAVPAERPFGIRNLDWKDILLTVGVLTAAVWFFPMNVLTFAGVFFLFRFGAALNALMNEWGHLAAAAVKYPSALTLKNFLGNRSVTDWFYKLFLFQKMEEGLHVYIPQVQAGHERLEDWNRFFGGLNISSSSLAQVRDQFQKSLNDLKNWDAAVRRFGWAAGNALSLVSAVVFFTAISFTPAWGSLVFAYSAGALLTLVSSVLSDFLSVNFPGIYNCGILWITLKRLDSEGDDAYIERMLKILEKLSGMMSLFGSHGVGAAMQVVYPNGKLDFIEFKMTPSQGQDSFTYKRIGRTGLIRKFMQEFRDKLAAAKKAGAKPRTTLLNVSGHVRLKTSGGKLTVDATQPFYINPGYTTKRWQNVNGEMTVSDSQYIAYSAANGDTNKARVPFDKDGPYYEESVWGRFFERVYGTKLGANDSEKAAYLMYFLRTQGSMEDSLRFAYVASFTKHDSDKKEIFHDNQGKPYSVKAIDVDLPSRSQFTSWETKLEPVIKKFGAQDWSRPDVMKQVLGEAERLLPAAGISNGISADAHRKFLERALTAFQKNDGVAAARMMMSMVDAHSTFGLFFESTLDPDKRIVISREQPVAVTENVTKGVQLGGSSYDFLRWSLRGGDPLYERGDSLRRIVLNMSKKTPDRGGEIAEIDHAAGTFKIYSMIEERELTEQEMLQGNPQKNIPPRWKDISAEAAEWKAEKLDAFPMLDDLKQALPLSLAVHQEWRAPEEGESPSLKAGRVFAERWAGLAKQFEKTAQILQAHGDLTPKQNLAPDLSIVVFREESTAVANWFQSLMRATFPLANIQVVNANEYIRDIDQHPKNLNTSTLFIDLGYNFPVIRTAEEYRRRFDKQKSAGGKSSETLGERAGQSSPSDAVWKVLEILRDRKPPHSFILSPGEETNISRALDPEQYNVIVSKYMPMVDGSISAAWSQIVSLNELHLYLMKKMREEFPSGAPLGMTFTSKDIKSFDAAFEQSIFEGLMDVLGLGFSAEGRVEEVETQAHSNLMKLSAKLIPYFTEQVRATFWTVIHLIITIAFTGTFFQIGLYFSLIWFSPVTSGPAYVISYLAQVLNIPLYLWFKYGTVRFMRLMEGREGLRRDSNPAIVIGEDVWGKLLEVNFSKMFGLAKGIVSPGSIHSSPQSTRLEGEHGHRTNRGSMVFLSVPQEMKWSDYVNAGHEAVGLLTKQVQSFSSLEAVGPMVVGIGDHPDLSKYGFVYSASMYSEDRSAMQKPELFDQPAAAGKILELAYNGPLRLMAHEVVFRDIVRRMQSDVKVGYDHAWDAEDNQNSLAATTTAPVRPPSASWIPGFEWVLKVREMLGGKKDEANEKVPAVTREESHEGSPLSALLKRPVAHRGESDLSQGAENLDVGGSSAPAAGTKRSENRLPNSRAGIGRQFTPGFETLEPRRPLSGFGSLVQSESVVRTDLPAVSAAQFQTTGNSLAVTQKNQALSAEAEVVHLDGDSRLAGLLQVDYRVDGKAVNAKFWIEYRFGAQGAASPEAFTVQIKEGQSAISYRGTLQRKENGFEGLVKDAQTGQVVFQVFFDLPAAEQLSENSVGPVKSFTENNRGAVTAVTIDGSVITYKAVDSGSSALESESSSAGQTSGSSAARSQAVNTEILPSGNSSGGGGGPSENVFDFIGGSGGQLAEENEFAPRLAAEDALNLYPPAAGGSAAERTAGEIDSYFAEEGAGETETDLEKAAASQPAERPDNKLQPPADLLTPAVFISSAAAAVEDTDAGWALKAFNFGLAFFTMLSAVFLKGKISGKRLLAVLSGATAAAAAVFLGILSPEKAVQLLEAVDSAAKGSVLLNTAAGMAGVTGALLYLSSRENTEAAASRGILKRAASRLFIFSALAVLGTVLFWFAPEFLIVKALAYLYGAVVGGFFAAPVLHWGLGFVTLPLRRWMSETIRGWFALNRKKNAAFVVSLAGLSGLTAAALQREMIPETVLPAPFARTADQVEARVESVTAVFQNDPWENYTRPQVKTTREASVKSQSQDSKPVTFQFQALNPRYNDYRLPENSAVAILARAKGTHGLDPEAGVSAGQWLNTNSVIPVVGGDVLLQVVRPVVETETVGNDRLSKYLDEKAGLFRDKIGQGAMSEEEHLSYQAAAVLRSIRNYNGQQEVDVFGRVLVPLAEGEKGIILPSRRFLGTPEPGAVLGYVHSQNRITLRTALPVEAWQKYDFLKMKTAVTLHGKQMPARVIRAALEPRLDGQLILTLALQSDDVVFDWDAENNRPFPVDLSIEMPVREQTKKISGQFPGAAFNHSYAEFDVRQPSLVESNETVGRAAFNVPESSWVRANQVVGGVREADRERLDQLASQAEAFERKVTQMIENYKKLGQRGAAPLYAKQIPEFADYLIQIKTFLAQSKVRDYRTKEAGLLVGTLDSQGQAFSGHSLAQVLPRQIFMNHRIEKSVEVNPGDIVIIRSAVNESESLGIVRQVEDLPVNKTAGEDDPRLYQEVRIEVYSGWDQWHADHQFDVEVMYSSEPAVQSRLQKLFAAAQKTMSQQDTQAVKNTPQVFPFRFISPDNEEVKLKLIAMLKEGSSVSQEVNAAAETVPEAVRRELLGEIDRSAVSSLSPEVRAIVENRDGLQRRIKLRFFLKNQESRASETLAFDLQNIAVHGPADVGQMSLDYMLERGWILDLISTHRTLYEKSPDLDMTKLARAHVLQLIETHREDSAKKDPLEHLIQRVHSADNLKGPNAERLREEAAIIQEFMVSLLVSKEAFANPDSEIAVRRLLESHFWPTFADKLSMARALENQNSESSVPLEQRQAAARRVRNFVFAQIAESIPMSHGEVHEHATANGAVKRFDPLTWARLHGMDEDENQDEWTLHSPWVWMIRNEAEPEENFKGLLGEERYRLALAKYNDMLERSARQTASLLTFLDFNPASGGLFRNHILDRLTTLEQQEDFFQKNPKSGGTLDEHALARFIDISERPENVSYQRWRGQAVDRLLEEDTPAARFLLARVFLKTQSPEFISILLAKRLDDLLINEVKRLKAETHLDSGVLLIYQQALAKFSALSFSDSVHEGQQRLALRVILDTLSDFELRELSRKNHQILNTLLQAGLTEETVVRAAEEQLARRETLWGAKMAEDWVSLPKAFEAKTHVKAAASMEDLNQALRNDNFHPERAAQVWQQGFQDDPAAMNLAADFYDLRKHQIESPRRDEVGFLDVWRYSIGWGIILFGMAGGAFIWIVQAISRKGTPKAADSVNETSAKKDSGNKSVKESPFNSIMRSARGNDDGGSAKRSEIRTAPGKLLAALGAKEEFERRQALEQTLRFDVFKAQAASRGFDYASRLSESGRILKRLAGLKSDASHQGELIAVYDSALHTPSFASQLSDFMSENPRVRNLYLIKDGSTSGQDWNIFKLRVKSSPSFDAARILFADEKGFSSLEVLTRSRMAAEWRSQNDAVQVLQPKSIASADKLDYEKFLLGLVPLSKETLLILGGDKPLVKNGKTFGAAEILEELFESLRLTSTSA